MPLLVFPWRDSYPLPNAYYCDYFGNNTPVLMEWLVEALQSYTFQRGDIVWAKMRGFCWWPAMILDPSDCNKEDSNPKKCWLFWFGQHSISEVSKEKMIPLNANFLHYSSSSCRKDFLKAINEALAIVASANDLNLYDNESSLLDWAKEGFQSSWKVEFRWLKAELPKFIQDSLSGDMDTSDESDANGTIEKVIQKVLNNEKSLEEICIGCCKENVTLVQPHPLFLGRVCQSCKAAVDRANRLACGSYQRCCIVCGQGGTLVFCSKRACYRAFCKECIEYLDSEKVFTKITFTQDWQCYLCEPVKRKNCLIRKRAMKRKAESSPTPVKSVCRSPNTSKINSKRKSQNDRESDDHNSSTIDFVIRDLLNKRKTFEEVCIACCEENVDLKCDHPLFLGKVCKTCEKDVMRICRLPCGKYHNFCVICGQGGNLVYCSISNCFRAYCETCIEYLDCKKTTTLSQILKQDDWLCYLCKPNPSKKCLIQKRIIDSGLGITSATCTSESFTSSTNSHDKVSGSRLQTFGFENAHDSEEPVFHSSSPTFCETASASSHARNDGGSVNNFTAPTSLSINNIESSTNCSALPTSVNTSNDGNFINHSTSHISDTSSNHVLSINNSVVPTSGCAINNGVSINYSTTSTFATTNNDEDFEKYSTASDSTSNERGFVNYSTVPTSITASNNDDFVNCSEAPISDNINNAKESLNYPAVYTSDNSNNYEDSMTCSASPASETFDDALEEVVKGIRHLRDTCISCLKKDELTYLDHPLFYARVCRHCQSDVVKVSCKLPVEERKDFCAICGKGNDTLVICKKKLCSRAYCKTCIERLDSKEAYYNIVRNYKWYCYLSEAYVYGNTKCLIRQKEAILHETSHSRLKNTESVNAKGDIRPYLWDGRADLDDICIACGKGEYELQYELNTNLYTNHPMFFGSICKLCIDDVKKVCELSSGKLRDFCIICGQGGCLVYCSRTKCSRAYCEECIEFLDSEDAFTEIVKNPIWLCYLCEPSNNPKCLIQKRYPPKYLYTRCKAIEVYKPPKLPAEEIVKKLWNGEISLEDICIACCGEVTQYQEHPLFKGLLCKKCVYNVHKACTLPDGQLNEFCVVCGQGGELVYCCNSRCLRSYCKLCIDYFDIDGIYSKILKNDSWFCYFCDLNPPSRCFIKRKAFSYVVVTDFPPVPENKTPIVVFASNEIGLRALKKAKISVGTYLVDRVFPRDLKHKADLVLGSCLVENEKRTRSEFAEDFFSSFSHFNFRRTEQLHSKSVVFFIFIGDYFAVDADILSRVADEFHYFYQFSKVRPILFQFGKRKFLVWTNLSPLMPVSVKEEYAGPYIDERQVIEQPFTDTETAEEQIYYYFIKYLRKYFQLEG